MIPRLQYLDQDFNLLKLRQKATKFLNTKEEPRTEALLGQDKKHKHNLRVNFLKN